MRISETVTRTFLRKLHGILLPIAAVLIANLNIPGANAIPFGDDPSLFGHFNQNAFPRICTDNAGRSYGCGVFAALNSFVFLENKYPDIYKTVEGKGKLIPEGSVGDAARNLAADMNCRCDGPDPGIRINDFIKGKEAYVNAQAPGTTRFENQSIYDQHGKRTKPAPTFDFIFKQVDAGQDVEVNIGFWQRQPDGSWIRVAGHFMTVTGGDSHGNTDTLSFINPFFLPSDGTAPSLDSAYSMTTNVADMNFTFPGGATDDVMQLANFYSQLQGKTNHPERNDTNTFTFVEAAVSESPIRKQRRVPEPSSLGIFVIGVTGLFLLRARRNETGGALAR